MASSPCYLVGIKSGRKKNGGAFYGCLRFLLQDKWQDYQVEKVWCEDEKQFYELIAAVTVGMSVSLTVEFGTGKVVAIAPNPDYPDLLLA